MLIDLFFHAHHDLYSAFLMATLEKQRYGSLSSSREMKSMSIQSLAEVDLDQFIMELTKKVVAVALLLHCATGFVSDQNSNFIDDPESSGIDFSTGTPGPDGTVCVQRQKFFDKTEKDQLKECFVQNVTTCYYTYITAYSDQEQEKCDEFFWKSCKIVFKTRPFNATSRICQRPLIKQCDQKTFTSSKSDLVCNTFFETHCNTTDLVPDVGDEPLAVTFCEKVPRKVCTPKTCRVVEGPERCEESIVQSALQQPTELCDLQPQKHCSKVKVAVPRLIPEKQCRQTEKQICNTRFANPHSVQKSVVIKYCTKRERVLPTYLPPPPPTRAPSRHPTPSPRPSLNITPIPVYIPRNTFPPIRRQGLAAETSPESPSLVSSNTVLNPEVEFGNWKPVVL